LRSISQRLRCGGCRQWKRRRFALGSGDLLTSLEAIRVRKKLSVRQGSSIQILCFMILETSDAREASNVPSIRTRRFYSRDDFFI
jgi:hypothetical protein